MKVLYILLGLLAVTNAGLLRDHNHHHHHHDNGNGRGGNIQTVRVIQEQSNGLDYNAPAVDPEYSDHENNNDVRTIRIVEENSIDSQSFEAPLQQQYIPPAQTSSHGDVRTIRIIEEVRDSHQLNHQQNHQQNYHQNVQNSVASSGAISQPQQQYIPPAQQSYSSNSEVSSNVAIQPEYLPPQQISDQDVRTIRIIEEIDNERGQQHNNVLSAPQQHNSFSSASGSNSAHLSTPSQEYIPPTQSFSNSNNQHFNQNQEVASGALQHQEPFLPPLPQSQHPQPQYLPPIQSSSSGIASSPAIPSNNYVPPLLSSSHGEIKTLRVIHEFAPSVSQAAIASGSLFSGTQSRHLSSPSSEYIPPGRSVQSHSHSSVAAAQPPPPPQQQYLPPVQSSSFGDARTVRIIEEIARLPVHSHSGIQATHISAPEQGYLPPPRPPTHQQSSFDPQSISDIHSSQVYAPEQGYLPPRQSASIASSRPQQQYFGPQSSFGGVNGQSLSDFYSAKVYASEHGYLPPVQSTSHGNVQQQYIPPIQSSSNDEVKTVRLFNQPRSGSRNRGSNGPNVRTIRIVTESAGNGKNGGQVKTIRIIKSNKK